MLYKNKIIIAFYKDFTFPKKNIENYPMLPFKKVFLNPLQINVLFRERYNSRQQDLFHVLAAYSMYNTEVSYYVLVAYSMYHTQ